MYPKTSKLELPEIQLDSRDHFASLDIIRPRQRKTWSLSLKQYYSVGQMRAPDNFDISLPSRCRDLKL